MLDGLRGFARTWPGKILGIFMLIGLAGFGMSGVFTSLNFNTIANVGSEEVSTRDFQRAYSRAINEFASQTGSIPTGQEAVTYGIVSNVINQLAVQAAIDGLGKNLKLGISDARLGQIVREDPSFASTLGSFDANNFRMALQQNGWTENDYFSLQAKVGIRQQLSLGLFDGIKVANTASKLVTRYGDDKRNIEYFIVSKDNMLPPSAPTNQEISKYLKDNQADFRNPEMREIKLFVLTPQIIADTLEVSDEEIATEYERTKTSYVRIESRTISQAILDSDLYEKRFEAGKLANESFEEIAAQIGLEISELGKLAQSQISDTRLSEAAFSLKEGEFTIIDGFDGKRAIFVSKIDAGGQIPFEEVKAQIAQNLKLKQARELYIDYLDQIEGQRAAFKPIGDIAAQFKLELVKVSISQTGNELEIASAIPKEARQRVANTIFRAKQGALVPSIMLGANLNIWFDLEEIIPESDKTLAQTTDEISQLLLDEKTQKELEKQVNEFVKSVKDGQDFAEAAISKQYVLLQVNDFSRLGNATGSIFAQEVIEPMFSGPAGLVSSAQNSGGDYIVFHVIEVIEASEVNEDAEQFIESSISESIFNEFVSALLDDAGLRINQQTLTQLIEPNSGNR